MKGDLKMYLNELSKEELRGFCRKHKIKGRLKLNKSNLVRLIVNDIVNRRNR
jgi:hypothetical protein